jgi:Ca-activated chloride channel family protein
VTFLAPTYLWSLLVLPLLILAYIALMRRHKKAAVRYANLDMVKGAIGAGQRLRRHVPPLLIFIGLALALLSVARPTTIITLPSQRQTIILALDISGSMRASDIDPTRITAAQAAARDFIKDQPANARIGVVAFSTSAMAIQQPTTNHDEAVAAVERLQPQRFTAVGSAILVGLQEIFPQAAFDDGWTHAPMEARPLRGAPLTRDPAPEPESYQPVPAGSYTSAVIVLLSDGQTNVGVDPIKAAHTAAGRGVRVFTVGFGTEQGGVVNFEGRSVFVRLDEETLKKVADITHGTYFRAGSEAELKKIYKSLTTQFVMETQKTEVTALLAAAAAFMTVLAAALSLLWFSRIA